MLREALPIPDLSAARWQSETRLSRSASVGAMLVTRKEGKRPLQVIVMPVHGSEGLGADCAVLVYLCDPEAVSASRSSALRTLYGLSPTECRLAEQLAAGIELRGGAAEAIGANGAVAFESDLLKDGDEPAGGSGATVLGPPGSMV